MTTLKVVSTILIVATVYLNIKHGWTGVSGSASEAEAKMFSDLGISPSVGMIVGVLSLIVALLTLIPQTFFVGNLLNAAIILVIMALALKTGNIRIAMIEIPFLILPLLLIWLGHPFKK